MQPRFLLAAALAVLGTLPAAAQTALPGSAAASAPPAGSNWQRVMALPIGTYLHVDARTRHSVCTLKSVAADSLTCERDTGVGTKELTFQRGEIRTIKIARRGRSAVLGASIGAGAGALAGGIVGLRSHYFAVRGAWAMIFAFAGAFTGAPAGYLSDFAASTVYRAP